MDFSAAWTKTADATKSTYDASATVVVNTLDSISPAFAPFASWWDRKADARLSLRTEENLKALIKAQREYVSARSTAATAKAQRRAARANSKNPLSGDRRAARKADKAASGHKSAAKADLKGAAANYPQKLTTVAAKWHAAHLLPTSALSYVLSSQEHWTVWPAGSSLALIAALPAALWLGRRQITAVVDDDASAEERRLMERLAPTYWVQNAEARGLSGTLTENPELTPAGIVCGVRLDGKWSAKELAGKADSVRALLGMKSETRMQISRGSHGDRALIVIRTRSASDGLDLNGWAPGDAWAVDTVTGETVPVPLGKRILIAGTSGSGKSTSARPLLAEASEAADHRLVIFDRKYVEARTWEHRARTASELDEMRTLVIELIEEGEERLKALPRGEDTVQISPERPRITVFVDEMGELLSDCAAKYKTEDGKTADYLDVIAGLRTVARKYRAAEIILVPATQKPTLSGDGHGLDSQIAGQLTIRLALAVATSTETQAVFGPDAIEKGWKAHELPMPWVALMRDQDKGPKQRTNPIRMRWMTAQQVIDLPARPVWRRTAAAPAQVPAPAPAPAIEAVGRPALRLVKDGGDFLLEPPSPAPAAEVPDVLDGLTDNQRAVYEAVRDGAATNAEISKATGINPGSVARCIDALVKRDALAKDGTAIRLGGAA